MGVGKEEEMETPGVGGDVINRERRARSRFGALCRQSWSCQMARSGNASQAPGNSSWELKIKVRDEGVNVEVNNQGQPRVPEAPQIYYVQS